MRTVTPRIRHVTRLPWRFAHGKLEPFNEGIEHRTINALSMDHDGTLWIGTTGALYALKKGTATRFAEGEGLSTPFVYSIWPAEDALWQDRPDVD